jgi:hypothetical protein
MLQTLANTNIVFYLMVIVGVLAVFAKLVSHITLKRLVRASSNMAKSTHRLIKLVRSKYEHTCMIYDIVENVDSFLEKYIYEYRVLGLRIHTWRQLERQLIWCAGILGALGAFAAYTVSGYSEVVYQYGAGGLAELVCLLVLYQLTDEDYKIETAKVYMTDYLENVYSHRFAKSRREQKEQLDVISPDIISMTPEQKEPLAINIEGKPKKMVHEHEKEKDNVQPALKEEAIRQILEEFLA